MTSQAIVLGGGCFWCTEAVYVKVKGVSDVESGYSNGHVERPSRRLLCFLGESVHDNDALALCGDINGSCDAILALHTHLPKFAFEMFDVRFSHRGDAVSLDELDDSQESLSNIIGKRVELPLDSLVQDLDSPNHIRQYISKKRLCPGLSDQDPPPAARSGRRGSQRQTKNAESAFANSAFSFFVARGRNHTWTTAFTVPIEVRVA